MSAAKKLSMNLVRRALDEAEARTGKRLSGYKANYGDATAEDVARAMMMKNRAEPVKKTKA